MTLPRNNLPGTTGLRACMNCPLASLILLGSLTLIAGCQSTPESVQPAAIVVTPTQTAELGTAAITSGQGQTSDLRTAADLDNSAFNSRSIRTPWLATIHDDFALARSLVEQELQVDLSTIRLQLVDDEPINTEVALETQRLVQQQFGNSDFADRFLDQVMHPLAGTYAALYSSRLGAVMISRNMLASYEHSLISSNQGQFKQAALLTLLIHELVHAADDQRYKIHENRALNFRASFAQSATFEGHAQYVTRRICEEAGCSAGLRALDNFMFSANEHNGQLTQPVEAISRSVLEYSYIEGERFVAGLAQRDNGAQLIDELLRTPPLDPIQILAPENFPDVARENRNQTLIRASRSIQHPWTEAPWIGVETSPLKGVDLRSDPTRRQAAVDGFTRLIQGMISMQFYDQQTPDSLPMEATILQAESANTARLFASMLHANTQQSGARVNDESLRINPNAEQADLSIDVHIYRTSIDTAANFRTSIAVAGQHVVQVSGSALEQALLDDYAIKVLMKLSTSESLALLKDPSR